MQAFPLSEVYQLLEPGPVVLLSTLDHTGKANVMTMSWHMVVDFEPPLLACIVSSENYSYSALLLSRECVIAIPTDEMANKVVQIGNTSGQFIDKIKEIGLTTLPAQQVAPPLITECFANLECKVVNTRLVNKYNLFVLEVIQAWIDIKQTDIKTIHHHGYGRFVVDGETIRITSNMR